MMDVVSFIRALIVLHRAFGKLPPKARLHVLIRFLTAPLLRVAAEIPRGARVLDIGAGHGVLAVLANHAHVISVEPDLRKIFWTAAAKPPLFVAGFDDCIRGKFDVITIIDVLYKIPVAEWDALIARAAARLRDGGLLIIKEQDPTARVKNSWNRAQEWLVSLVGLTLGESFSYEAPREFMARLERAGFTDVRAKRIDRFYPHPHVLYQARRSAAGR
jgi:SAM-dependent methyltransferase